MTDVNPGFSDQKLIPTVRKIEDLRAHLDAMKTVFVIGERKCVGFMHRRYGAERAPTRLRRQQLMVYTVTEVLLQIMSAVTRNVVLAENEKSS